MDSLLPNLIQNFGNFTTCWDGCREATQNTQNICFNIDQGDTCVCNPNNNVEPAPTQLYNFCIDTQLYLYTTATTSESLAPPSLVPTTIKLSRLRESSTFSTSDLTSSTASGLSTPSPTSSDEKSTSSSTFTSNKASITGDPAGISTGNISSLPSDVPTKNAPVGVIIGGVIGGLVCVVLILTLSWLILREKRRRRLFEGGHRDPSSDKEVFPRGGGLHGLEYQTQSIWTPPEDDKEKSCAIM